MPDDYTGTNTEKIQQLILDVTTLIASLQIASWVIGISVPVLVGLGVFLVAKTYENSAKLDRIADQVDRMERNLDRDQGRGEAPKKGP